MATRLPDITGPRRTVSPNSSVQGYDSQAVARATVQSGQRLTQTADVLYEKNQKRQEELDEFDYARAKSSFLKASLDAESALDNDNNYTTYEERTKTALEKARADAASIISDPRLKERFGLETDNDMARALVGVRRKAKTKEIDYGRSVTDETLDQNHQAYLAAVSRGDEKTAAQILDSSNSLVRGATTKGYYDMEAAGNKRRQYVDKLVEDRAYLMSDEEKVKAFKPDRLISAQDALAPAAQKFGIDPDFLVRTAALESAFDSNAVNPQSRAAGLFQFMPKTAKQYGLTNPNDSEQSAMAAAQLARDNRRVMTEVLGREVTNAELYLAHQQGAGGAAALLKNPDQNVLSVMTQVYDGDEDFARKAITQNGGSTDMTAGDFANKWLSKFEAADVPSAPEIAFYNKTNTWRDLVPMRKRKEIYQQGLSGLSSARKLEEQQFQQQTREFLVSVLPKVQAAGGDWSVLTREEQAMADSLNMTQKVKGYKGTDSPDVLAMYYKMSPEDREAALDSPEFMLGLSTETWNGFKKSAEKARTAGGKAVERTRAQLVKDGFEAIGLDPGGAGDDKNTKLANQEFARFNQLLDEEIAAYSTANNSKLPSNQELQGMVDGLLRPMAVGKKLRNGDREEVYLHKIKVDDIPADEAEAIRRSRKKRGLAVTNASVIRSWLMMNESNGRDIAEQQAFDAVIASLTGE